MREAVVIEEPKAAKFLFASTKMAWVWLVVRLWLGWEWLHAGWGKVFGGNITWKFWDWGSAEYSITGDGSIGWVRSGTVVGPDGTEQVRGVGDSVAGFAQGAIASSEGPHPDVAYSWYVNFLEWIRDTAHPVFGPVVAVGELVIGIMLILGLFTGIMAFLGALLNFNFAFSGSAGANPAMIAVSGLLILSWRNAGYIGLDRWVLPALGTPWHRGKVLGGEVEEAKEGSRSAGSG